MNNEQLKALLIIAEDALKQSPVPRIHMDAESCVELIREVLEIRGCTEQDDTRKETHR